MSDTTAAIVSGAIISALTALLMSCLAYGEISKREKQITVLQTQLAEAKESQRHADMKFNLCMRQLK